MCFNLLTLNSLCHTSIPPRLLRTSLWLFGCLQHEKTVKKLSKLMAIHWGDPSCHNSGRENSLSHTMLRKKVRGHLSIKACFYSAGNPAWRHFQAGVPVVPQPMFPGAISFGRYGPSLHDAAVLLQSDGIFPLDVILGEMQPPSTRRETTCWKILRTIL